MNRKLVLCLVLMLFLAETSLLSADHQSAQLTTQADANPTLNNSNLASSYDNVTIHGGNLTINGTQTFVIENCTYIQTGNVYVTGEGKLFIIGASFEINQTYNGEFQFSAQDQATVQLESSEIVSAYEGPSLSFNGQSKGIINNSQLLRSPVSSGDTAVVNITQSKFQEAGPSGNSEMLISNSEFEWATNLSFDGDDIIDLEGLRPGYYAYWNLRLNQTFTNVPYDFTLVNTSVVAWSLFFDYNTIAKVSDSTVDRIAFSLYDRGIEADGVKPGVYVNWTLCNMTLINVNVTSHWVFLFYGESSGVIRNTHAYLSLFNGNTNISVTDSYVLLTADRVNSGDLGFLGQSTFTLSHLGIHN